MAYNMNYKTELCRSWLAGQSCKYGPGCQFAHGQQELRKKAYPSVGMGMSGMSTGMSPSAGMSMYAQYGYTTPTMTPMVQQAQQYQSPTKFDPKKYKTAVCRHWQTTGTCQMGPMCKFAHGETELRQYGGVGGTPIMPTPTQNQHQNGESLDQQRGIKRPYTEDNMNGDGVTNCQPDAQQGVGEFGGTLDYLYSELARKGLTDDASVLCTEVYNLINKYSAILSNDGQEKTDGQDGDGEI